MDKTTLIILICAGVFVVLVGIIIMIRISNRKRFKRLQDNLKKLNQEKEDMDYDDKVTLPSQNSEATYTVSDYETTSEAQPIIEDYQTEEKIEEIPFENVSEENINPFLTEDYKPQPIKEDDDFEKFMNEHSFSRRVFNKPLVDKIKKLPRDVRILLLSNVFDRIDDK